jgi:hypothetical protein
LHVALADLLIPYVSAQLLVIELSTRRTDFGAVCGRLEW